MPVISTKAKRNNKIEVLVCATGHVNLVAAFTNSGTKFASQINE